MGEDQYNGNCTVTLVLRIVPPFRRGKCCPFFCVWFGVVCLFFCSFSLLRVAVWKNFRERTFVFGGLCWFCFFGEFLPRFLFYVLALRSRNCLEKFSSCQVFCFGFVLSFLGFSGRRRFCLPFCFCFTREKAQVVTGHHTPLHFFFFCFCSRRICVITRFGRASFVSGVFLGVPFWAPCVFQILSELAGLELARPL